jgi:hypothetical protein
MPLSPEEMALFRAHVEKHMKAPECPFCGHSQWQFGGPVMQPSYDETAEMAPAGIALGYDEVFPLVFLMCQICFYVYQFSWLSIQEKARENG